MVGARKSQEHQPTARLGRTNHVGCISAVQSVEIETTGTNMGEAVGVVLWAWRWACKGPIRPLNREAIINQPNGSKRARRGDSSSEESALEITHW